MIGCGNRASITSKEAGLNREYLLLLAAMMRKVVRRVVLDGSCSDQFPVEVGVPQGSVLSPWLYSMYIDGLHGALRSKVLGVWVLSVGSFAFVCG